MTSFIGGALIGLAVTINRDGDITEMIIPCVLMVLGIIALKW